MDGTLSSYSVAGTDGRLAWITQPRNSRFYHQYSPNVRTEVVWIGCVEILKQRISIDIGEIFRLGRTVAKVSLGRRSGGFRTVGIFIFHGSNPETRRCQLTSLKKAADDGAPADVAVSMTEIHLWLGQLLHHAVGGPGNPVQVIPLLSRDVSLSSTADAWATLEALVPVAIHVDLGNPLLHLVDRGEPLLPGGSPD